MFVKISAFFITSYIFSTVSANSPNVSEDQFISFPGQKDPCDTRTTTYLQQICQKAAARMNYICARCIMNYSDGYPKCIDTKIELQKGDGKGKGAVQLHFTLLDCNAKEGNFLLGRGESTNGAYRWSAEDGVAYPQADVDDVFPLEEVGTVQPNNTGELGEKSQ